MFDDDADQMVECRSSATYTVPGDSTVDLFTALHRLKDDAAESQQEGNSIFLKKGVHNLTEHGDIELDWEVHIMGEPGTVVAGWAEPLLMSPVPEYGGGRWRLTAGATGR